MDHLLGDQEGGFLLYFHQSSTTAHVLKNKQEMLQCSCLLIHNKVGPHLWYCKLENSEEKCCIITLSDDDVKVAEEVLQLLKTVTTVLHTEVAPSVSMTLPLKTRILYSIRPHWRKTAPSQKMSSLSLEDLKSTYTSSPTPQDFLYRSNALDPKFKSLSHPDHLPYAWGQTFHPFIASSVFSIKLYGVEIQPPKTKYRFQSCRWYKLKIYSERPGVYYRSIYSFHWAFYFVFSGILFVFKIMT